MNRIRGATRVRVCLTACMTAFTVAFAVAFVGCSDPTVAPDTTGDLPTGLGYLTQLGAATVSDRFTAEVWVRGNTGYTTTWGNRGGNVGNAIKIWDVSSATPQLVDSVIVSSAGTLGDVQVSDDGTLLVVAIEHAPNGGLALYSLSNPRQPQLVKRFATSNLSYGVHTAEVARVAGRLYAFCAVDPASGIDAKLVIVDITDPASPTEVTVLPIGYPFVHDVFVRDGLLFTAEWYQGLGIYDIGAQSGSVANPKFISRVYTVGGQVHNVWWFHDPTTGSKRFAFVGEEGPSVIGSSSQGDIHVVDLQDLTQPKEVAFFRVTGAGTHNFSMDEANGILYAAYYNAGVRAFDVRGDLGTCDMILRHRDGRCQLQLVPERTLAVQPTNKPVYVWGVQFTGNTVYGSDMLNGLYKFAAVKR